MQDLVAIGFAGMAAAAQLASEKTDELRKRFRSDIVRDMTTQDSLPEPLYVIEDEGELIKTNAGFVDTIYNTCIERKCGCEIELKKIPVKQKTIEICELYRLDPYRIETEGYILICDDGRRCEKELRERGIPAAHIGKLTKGPAKIIIDKTEIEYINKN